MEKLERPQWMDDPVYRKLDGEVDRIGILLGNLIAGLLIVVLVVLPIVLFVIKVLP